MALAQPIDSRDARAEDNAPANREAEQALLGILLYENGALETIGDLAAADFREPLHGRLFETIKATVGKDVIADPTMLLEHFEKDDRLAELGGIVFLADLVDKAPPANRAPHYAAAIKATALRRALIKLGKEMAGAADANEHDPADLIRLAEQSLSQLAHGAGDGRAWASAGSVVSSAVAIAKATTGLPGLSSGLRDLDDITGGFRRGVSTLIAGRPGMAKSTAALQVAKACAGSGKGCVFFSMEMPEFDLGLRLASDLAFDRYVGMDNPTYFAAAKGQLSAAHWRLMDQAADAVRDWPLDFDPRPALTIPQMLAATRRRFREWERRGVEPGCVIIDHLTIAKPDQDRKGNKVAETEDISRGIAEMAKTLDVPVVALCQLSRAVEQRGNDKRPTLSDLRWTGALEQDARLVCFLYRPEYYLRKPEDPTDLDGEMKYRTALEKHKHKLFWLVEKNNNGPTGEVETFVNIACSAIRDRGSS